MADGAEDVVTRPDRCVSADSFEREPLVGFTPLASQHCRDATLELCSLARERFVLLFSPPGTGDVLARLDDPALLLPGLGRLRGAGCGVTARAFDHPVDSGARVAQHPVDTLIVLSTRPGARVIRPLALGTKTFVGRGALGCRSTRCRLHGHLDAPCVPHPTADSCRRADWLH
ncbi:MAG TPA: hypothetical protein VM925_06455 [Labilithrix sp.]|nr:hypothetical protein [Labilithrix sp.]